MLFLAAVLMIVGWICLVLPFVPRVFQRVSDSPQAFILVGAFLNVLAFAIAFPIATQAG